VSFFRVKENSDKNCKFVPGTAAEVTFFANSLSIRLYADAGAEPASGLAIILSRVTDVARARPGEFGEELSPSRGMVAPAPAHGVSGATCRADRDRTTTACFCLRAGADSFVSTIRSISQISLKISDTAAGIIT
jgi:hypothetical protein